MNHRNKPLVSVIITTYRNEEYLSRAVESVFDQSYSQIELIVVDDNEPGSAERRNTEIVMEKYPRALYLKHPENRNGAAARNTGIRAARGKYIAFLDNDDIYFSTHIETCVKALEERPEYGAAVCGVVKIRGGICWEIIYPPEGDMVKALFLSETALGTGSNLFLRADLVRKIRGFDESFRRHQDIEFGIRAFSQYPAYRICRVQIVKEMDGHSNMPGLEKFLETKYQFMEKFEREIAGLTEEEQKKYYAGQYGALLYAACREGNEEQIRWVVKELKKYRSITYREKMLVKLSACRALGVYEWLKRQAKQKKSIYLYRKVIKSLAEKDRKKFRAILRG